MLSANRQFASESQTFVRPVAARFMTERSTGYKSSGVPIQLSNSFYAILFIPASRCQYYCLNN
jgi:hypothetical protein